MDSPCGGATCWSRLLIGLSLGCAAGGRTGFQAIIPRRGPPADTASVVGIGVMCVVECGLGRCRGGMGGGSRPTTEWSSSA